MKSFDKEDFDKAIDNEDFSSLRSYVISAVRNDPTFSKEEVMVTIKKLDEKANKIFEGYQLQEGEEPFSEDIKLWNKEYFIKQTFWLGENFNKNRINRIKRVGQHVYGNQNKDANFQEATTVLKVAKNRTTCFGGTVIKVILIILIIISLVAIITRHFR